MLSDLNLNLSFVVKPKSPSRFQAKARPKIPRPTSVAVLASPQYLVASLYHLFSSYTIGLEVIILHISPTYGDLQTYSSVIPVEPVLKVSYSFGPC